MPASAVLGVVVPVDLDLNALYREHQGFLRWAIRAWGVPESAVDDTVQEVFVAALRRRGTAPENGLRKWLIAVARNATFVARRSHARRRDRDTDWYECTRREPPALDDLLEHHRALERLEHALARLPEVQRSTYLLVDLGGMTANDVAALHGISPNTVASRLRWARQTLREACAPPPEQADDAVPRARRARALWLGLLPRPSFAGAPLLPIAAGTAVLAATAMAFVTASNPASPARPLVAPDRTALHSGARVPFERAPLTNTTWRPAVETREPRKGPTTAPASLRAESRLLRRLAQAIDRGDLAHARALSQAYVARFPEGRLHLYHQRLHRHLESR